MALYSEEFFTCYIDDSKGSAEQVVPLVMELLSPKSVIDVGCGIGTWLSVFRERGVENIFGIDGAYVNPDQLLIPKADFFPHDLAQPLPSNLGKSGPFDLVVSLEVAEHLPAEKAEHFVTLLTSLSPVIMFSAAIPHQGGTHHVNEQWPNYWAKLFDRQGYTTVDWLRPQVWNNPKVAYYYSQNTLLFVKREHLDQLPKLHRCIVSADDGWLARIHPLKWNVANDPSAMRLKYILPAIPAALFHAVMARFKSVLRKR